MNEKVFVDTGGWIACISKNDSHHEEAISYISELREHQVPLITSNYILEETITWLSYNNLHNKAVKVKKLWREAEKNGSLKIHWVDKNIAEEAWEIFKKYSDQKLSFTDCTSFAICRKTKTKKVFGFDNQFNVLGFLLSPYQVHEKGVEYKILRPGCS